MKKTKGIILLEDGTTFSGEIATSSGEPIIGELVFNTNMVGYQEVLTDPSYAGQLVVMTYPLIGNYGVSPLYSQSPKVQTKGLIVRELWGEAEYRPARIQLEEFLAIHGTPVVTGVDTRALTRHLRKAGTMKGVCASAEYSLDELREMLEAAPDFGSLNFLPEVSCSEPTYYSVQKECGKIAIIDLGLKKGILHSFLERGYSVVVLPFSTTPQEVLSLDVDGVLFSNGPGNPALLREQVQLAKSLIGKLPVFGICLGHQIIALALGAKTYKLKFGHRGGNHPVRDLETGKVYITAQNHGYAVDEESLAGTGLVVTHRNLNDDTVEGLVHQYLPVVSVQFHPEGSPGTLDATHLFDRFIHYLPEAKAS